MSKVYVLLSLPSEFLMKNYLRGILISHSCRIHRDIANTFMAKLLKNSDVMCKQICQKQQCSSKPSLLVINHPNFVNPILMLHNQSHSNELSVCFNIYTRIAKSNLKCTVNNYYVDKSYGFN